ncbi:unnamed protein product [Didymodactylos carnosus]|uniref:Uncharacterized protein n=1 Tax=Didymodactylos carnosus TaxID=1234261 RepID=A0A814RHP2_9BILA|nr:unnamed protein product [Didymodactylos carnosus]CAF1133358.1 unnamed protein product [Didymodactylos carnosus]CAF3718450.1 unnamed protein product [Didymodactylos carnosus]CAF3897166.1 unnamed protein product [Didymodactylos carnosus]
MLIIVLYGDNQRAIFNPDCKTINLISSIRKNCRCDRNICVDLCDLTGDLRHISESAEQEYASALFKDREKLVLIRIEKQNDQTLLYTPLLKDENTITNEFLSHLYSRDRNKVTESYTNKQIRPILNTSKQSNNQTTKSSLQSRRSYISNNQVQQNQSGNLTVQHTSPTRRKSATKTQLHLK